MSRISDGILIRMPSLPATSIRVTVATRDELRALANADGATLEQAIRQLVRAERQRRMGRDLAAPASSEEQAWLDLSAHGGGSDAGG
jgi:hypothetical protein